MLLPLKENKKTKYGHKNLTKESIIISTASQLQIIVRVPVVEESCCVKPFSFPDRIYAVGAQSGLTAAFPSLMHIGTNL